MDPLFITLPLILFTGLVSSWFDIKKGLIPNMLVFPLFFFGMLVGVFFSDFLLFSLNLFFSLVLSFSFWKLRWWYGGDAKLFLVYAILVPVTAYGKEWFPYFPALTLLTNTLIPLSFLFFISLLRRPSYFSLQSVMIAGLNVFSLAWISSFFVSSPLLIFAGVFLLSKVFDILPHAYVLQGLLALLRLFYDTSLATPFSLIHFILWTFLLLAVRQFLSQNAHKLVYSTFPQQGTILAEEVTLANHRLAKGSILTERQAHSITVPILAYETISFAPCIFLGVLLTLFAQSIFFTLVTRFI